MRPDFSIPFMVSLCRGNAGHIISSVGDMCLCVCQEEKKEQYEERSSGA